MVERPDRGRIDDEERAPTGREWEVFVREAGDDPMRHVGSVRARTADAAHELASRLFAWYATDLWLCPADATRRYTTTDLADDRTAVETAERDERRPPEWSA